MLSVKMCNVIDKSFKLETVYLAWRFNKNVFLMPEVIVWETHDQQKMIWK